VWRELLKSLKIVLLIVLVFYAVGRVMQGWQPDFDDLQQRRFAAAKSSEGPIDIALSWVENDYNSGFLEGTSLAVDTLNGRGGILGRKVKTRLYGQGAEEASRAIALNTQHPVIIGHETSSEAIPASITYQRSGLLFIAPYATHPDLTVHEFNLVFRSVPDDRAMVLKLAELGALQGAKGLAVLCVRNAYGTSLRQRIEEYSEDNGVKVVEALSYSEQQADFREVAYQIRGYTVDGIFVGDYVPRVAHLIKQLRAQGITVPILGCDGLDDHVSLWEIAGKSSDDTFVVSVYDPPGDISPSNTMISAYEREFLDGFAEAGNGDPDVFAASAYDAVMLYAQAAEKAQTTDPLVVASMLKYGGPWEGLTGKYSFDAQGNVVGKKLIIKGMSGGEFRPMRAEGEKE